MEKSPKYKMLLRIYLLGNEVILAHNKWKIKFMAKEVNYSTKGHHQGWQKNIWLKKRIVQKMVNTNKERNALVKTPVTSMLMNPMETSLSSSYLNAQKYSTWLNTLSLSVTFTLLASMTPYSPSYSLSASFCRSSSYFIHVIELKGSILVLFSWEATIV